MSRSGADYLESRWQRRLGRLAERQQLRELPPPLPSGAIDVSHNDYLALIPELSRLSSPLPAASGGSRLLGGQHEIYASVEQDFSRFKGGGASLLFNSGFAANEAVIHCLNLPDVGFFYDAYNHASVMAGLTLAKIPPHRRLPFRHQDLGQLRQLLKASPFACNVVIVESVYSMDGDLADLDSILELCTAHRGMAVVDEAHALGVYGERGEGRAQPQQGLITVNPCGKGMASHGAFITASDAFRQYAINTARSFIYTTALPPRHADILRQTISVVAASGERRRHLAAITAEFHQALGGIDRFGSTSHIVPIRCSSAEQAVSLSKYLLSQGFYARAVRFPTVARGAERVRISLNASLSSQDIGRLAAAIAKHLP